LHKIAMRNRHHDSVIQVSEMPHSESPLLPDHICKAAIAQIGNVPEGNCVRVQVYSAKVSEGRQPQKVGFVLHLCYLNPPVCEVWRLDMVKGDARNREDALCPRGS
jgi:hypothetical protein